MSFDIDSQMSAWYRRQHGGGAAHDPASSGPLAQEQAPHTPASAGATAHKRFLNKLGVAQTDSAAHATVTAAPVGMPSPFFAPRDMPTATLFLANTLLAPAGSANKPLDLSMELTSKLHALHRLAQDPVSPLRDIALVPDGPSTLHNRVGVLGEGSAQLYPQRLLATGHLSYLHEPAASAGEPGTLVLSDVTVAASASLAASTNTLTNYAVTEHIATAASSSSGAALVGGQGRATRCVEDREVNTLSTSKPLQDPSAADQWWQPRRLQCWYQNGAVEIRIRDYQLTAAEASRLIESVHLLCVQKGFDVKQISCNGQTLWSLPEQAIADLALSDLPDVEEQSDGR